MALGAVLISLSVAFVGSIWIWMAESVQAYEAILIYVGLGTLALLGYAFVMGTVRSDDSR